MPSRHASRRAAVALLAVLGVPAGPRAWAQERNLVHILARGVRTTVGVYDGRAVEATAMDPVTGLAIPPPAGVLEDPDREVWIVGQGRKTRILYQGGAETERRTWDRSSGEELAGDLHLTLPSPLDEGRLPNVEVVRIDAPRPAGEGASPPPTTDVAPAAGFVGEALPATDLFGETLGGLLPAETDRPKPLSFSGYVDVNLVSGGDGPSPHVAENGLNGNRGLEVREGVLEMDASLGDGTRFFGQIRAVRFNRFDMRVAMLQLGDPGDDHWRIGRMVHPFGTFPLRNLSDRNPLWGFPLAYGYRTSLATNAAPAGLAGIQAARGTGGGSGIGGPGLYQSYITYNPRLSEKVTAMVGLSNGALGNNENVTANDAFGFVAQLAFKPRPAIGFGFSASAAPYMRTGATGLAAGEKPEDFDQTLIGFDARYDKGRFRLDLEAIWSDWDTSASAGVSSLGAFTWYAEGTWSVGPKSYLAGRYSAISFDEVATGAGGTATWDADVSRAELGIGYRPTRNMTAKLVGQFNDTDGGADPDDNVVALQLVGSF